MGTWGARAGPRCASNGCALDGWRCPEPGHALKKLAPPRPGPFQSVEGGSRVRGVGYAGQCLPRPGPATAGSHPRGTRLMLATQICLLLLPAPRERRARPALPCARDGNAVCGGFGVGVAPSPYPSGLTGGSTLSAACRSAGRDGTASAAHSVLNCQCEWAPDQVRGDGGWREGSATCHLSPCGRGRCVSTG